MFEEFHTDTYHGKIRTALPGIDKFDAALYQSRLFKLYGDVEADLTIAFIQVGDDFKPNPDVIFKPTVQAALEVYNSITAFAALAPRICEFHGAVWAKSSAQAEIVDETFRLWMSDEELKQAIADADKRLQRPNGAVGSPPDLLTEAEKNSPLSVIPASSTKKTSKSS